MNINEKRGNHIDSIFIREVEEIIENMSYSAERKIDLIKRHLETTKRLKVR